MPSDPPRIGLKKFSRHCTARKIFYVGIVDQILFVFECLPYRTSLALSFSIGNNRAMSEKQRSLCKDVYRAHDESKAWSLYSRKDRKHVLATMSQRAYYSFRGVDCKNLLWEIAIIKNMRYHAKKTAS